MTTLRVLVLTAAALAAVACSGGSKGARRQTTAKVECVIKVYFSPHAPRSPELRLARRLRADRRVARVSFVSKQAALKRERRKYPQLYANIPYNPLPDSLVVRPAKTGAEAGIAAAARRAPAGVNDVHWKGDAC